MSSSKSATDVRRAGGASFDIATLSRVGGRPENEDYTDFLQAAAASCWVLADGLGGHRGGATASKAVVEGALASFRERPEVSPAAARAHVARAQAALVAAQAGNPALAQMRSTIVVLISSGREAVWAHVGDSRLYHLRGGQIVERTRDHSVSQALVDVGQIDAHDQGAHEDRSRLLRCLGKDDAEAGATVSGPHALTRGDAFLLCTDGFWEALDPVAMALDYAGAEDAGGWLERMEARLRRGDRPLHDNYTATAVRLTAADLPVPPRHDPRQPASVAEPAHEHDRPGVQGTVDGWGAWRRAGLIAAVAVALLAFAAGVAVGLLPRPGLFAWLERWWHPAEATTTVPPVDRSEPHAQTPEPRQQQVVPGTPQETPTSPDAKPPASAMVPPVVASGTGKDEVTAPSALPRNTVFRPGAGVRYTSLQAAIRAAAAGETIWIGPGEFKEALEPIALPITLKGAGRDATRLSFAGHHGLVFTADGGGLEDLEACCAAGDAVLEVGGAFRGTIAHVRLARSEGWGVLLRGSAAPTFVDTLIDDNRKGRISVQDHATLTWQP